MCAANQDKKVGYSALADGTQADQIAYPAERAQKRTQVGAAKKDIFPQKGRSHLARDSSIPFGERPTCTVAEACSAAGLGKTKFYELMRMGKVDSTTLGRRRLVRVPSLLRLLNEERE